MRAPWNRKPADKNRTVAKKGIEAGSRITIDCGDGMPGILALVEDFDAIGVSGRILLVDGGLGKEGFWRWEHVKLAPKGAAPLG